MASAVLNPINSTLIAVALVPIGQTFGAGPARTAWLVSALYLATAIGQPVLGQLVDRFGPRRVLLAGAGIVLVAGAAGMLALSVGWLIGVRAVLGLGTCAGFPAAMAVLRRRAEELDIGVPARVLAVLSISAQTIMVVGPTLGGALIGLAGWPAIFAVNVPLAGVSLLLALRWVPRDPPAERAAAPLDWPGIVLFALALSALLGFLMEPHPQTLWFLGVAVVLAAGFLRRELRTAAPFLDLRTLGANRPILRTYLRQALSFLVIYSVLFGYVQWLEAGRGLSESAAGALLLPMSGVAVGAAALSGRTGGVWPRLVGVGVALVLGSGLLLLLGPGTPTLLLVGVTAVFGLAQGMTSVTNQTTLYREAATSWIGTASGLFRTAQYLGAIAAATVIALCLGPRADAAGLHRLGLVLLAVSALLLVVTLTDRGLRRARG